MNTVEKVILVLIGIAIILVAIPQTRALFQGSRVIADLSISRGVLAAPAFNDAQSTIKASKNPLAIVGGLISIPFTGEKEVLRMYVDGAQCAETSFNIDRGASTQQTIYCSGLSKGTHSVRVDLVTPTTISDSISAQVTLQ